MSSLDHGLRIATLDNRLNAYLVTVDTGQHLTIGVWQNELGLERSCSKACINFV